MTTSTQFTVSVTPIKYELITELPAKLQVAVDESLEHLPGIDLYIPKKLD